MIVFIFKKVNAMQNSSSSYIIDIYIHRLQYFFNNHQLKINFKKTQDTKIKKQKREAKPLVHMYLSYRIFFH